MALPWCGAKPVLLLLLWIGALLWSCADARSRGCRSSVSVGVRKRLAAFTKEAIPRARGGDRVVWGEEVEVEEGVEEEEEEEEE